MCPADKLIGPVIIKRSGYMRQHSDYCTRSGLPANSNFCWELWWR